MSAYVYILRCADGQLYYGSTNKLIQRLRRHASGQVKSTKWRLPVKLLYFEEAETLAQARQRERRLKNRATRRKTIERLIADFAPERLVPFASVASQGFQAS